MKALTICQPYAHLIALELKPIENRTWPTSVRGDIAIHAGKSRAWLDDDDESRYPTMVFGAVICIAQLYDCLLVSHLPAELRNHEHANGPFCFLLRNIRRIAPVPLRGAQGFFEIPYSMLSQKGVDPEPGT